MKNRNRILSSILAIILIMSAFMTPVFAESNKSTDGYEVYEKKVLSALGITSENTADDKTVTRAEFSDIFVKFLQAATAEKPDMSDVSDVENEYTSAPAIRFMIDNGYLEKDRNRNFYPGSGLTYADVSRALVKALGYEPWVTAKKVTDTSYVSCLKRIGITVEGKSTDSTLTYADLTGILFTALEVNLLEVKAYSSEKTQYTNTTGATPLSVWFKMSVAEGILYSAENGTASLAVDSVGKEYVRIGKNVYDAGKTEAGDLQGYAVKGYYSTAQKDNNTLAVVIPLPGVNKITLIDAEDVVSFKGNTLTAEINGKQKKYSIPVSAEVIYNGEAVPSAKRTEAFEVESGTIMINDVKYNNKGIIVTVTAYDNYVVGAIDKDKGVVYDKLDNTKKLDLSNENSSIKMMKADGSAIDISQISVGDILSVAKSLNSNRIKVIKSQKTVTGNYTAYGSLDSTSAYIMIDGVKRTLAQNYRKAKDQLPALNNSVTVYLDAWDKVANVVAAGSGDYQIGILKQVAHEGVVGFTKNHLKMKIFMLDGKMYEYDAIDRLVVDNYRTKDPQDAENVLTAVTGISVYQPIRFMVNSDGKVSNIDTTYLNEAAGESEDSLRYIWRSYQNDYTTRGYGSDIMYKQWANGNFGRKFYTSQWPTFLKLPRTNQVDDKYFLTQSAIVDGRYYYVDAVAVGRETFTSGVIIQYYDAGEGSTEGDELKYGAVTNVCEELDNDGFSVKKITYVIGSGGEETRVVDDDCDLNAVPPINNYNSKTYSLSSGDMAAITYDATGVITDVKMIYDAESKDWNNDMNYVRADRTEGVVNCNLDANELLHGYVLQNDSSHMRITGSIPTEVNDTVMDNAYVAYIGGSKIYVFDSNRKRLIPADSSKIISYKYSNADCSEVIFGGQGGVTPFVIIYE